MIEKIDHVYNCYKCEGYENKQPRIRQYGGEFSSKIWTEFYIEI